jgi:hypothetical protein
MKVLRFMSAMPTCLLYTDANLMFRMTVKWHG